tara:strand:+ start:97 stop:459 length:363 start_codon:yes stop_codon:yes gene_type:complete
MKKIYYYTYKTINLLNGEYYIGRKKSTTLYDKNYYGSGRYIQDTPIDYLLNGVISYYDNMEELTLAEDKLLNKHINNPLCKNIAPTGTKPTNRGKKKEGELTAKGQWWMDFTVNNILNNI